MDKYKDIFVLVNDNEISLDKCAKVYKINPDLLYAEFMDTGDINASIINSITKERISRDIRNYVYHTPIDVLKKNYAVMDSVTNKLREQKFDVYNYIYHCDEDYLNLSVSDIISILIDDSFNKPLVNNTNKEFIDKIINYCKNSNKNEDLEINKADVKMILKIIDEYRLSINDTYSLINKYESLIDLNDNYDYIGEPEEFVYDVTDDYELENKKGRSR